MIRSAHHETQDYFLSCWWNTICIVLRDKVYFKYLLKQQVSVRLQKTDFNAKYKCLFPLRIDNILHVVIQSEVQIECLTNHQPYDMLLRLNDVDQSVSTGGTTCALYTLREIKRGKNARKDSYLTCRQVELETLRLIQFIGLSVRYCRQSQ